MKELEALLGRISDVVWGPPLLIGPGSIHVAHTDEAHIAVDELTSAVDLYESLLKRLLLH